MTRPRINAPKLWLETFPKPTVDGHKYQRGHALIFASPELTGATRLAASACSRIGAGLVTVISPQNAGIYRSTLPADIMVREELPPKSSRITAVLGGSGGVLVEHRDALLDNIFETPRVFDADAIPQAADFYFLDSECVLTPHEGEFERCFPDLKGTREQRALNAAEQCGAVIVLKGPRTIIAHPDGRHVVNEHASPYLAKAGTGDVLAGMIAGIIAQGMPIFDACCAAVWMHGEAAISFGPGLISSDIPDLVPHILRTLLR
jgi:hydroxyethylthiazole kinase-like uncharacterized protein yjeF